MTIKDRLRVLFTPSCWLQNYPYSALWDAELNRLMANHYFEPTDPCQARIGGTVVWTANHPYASFIMRGLLDGIRPSRITILKAGDRLVHDAMKYGKEKAHT